MKIATQGKWSAFYDLNRRRGLTLAGSALVFLAIMLAACAPIQAPAPDASRPEAASAERPAGRPTAAGSSVEEVRAQLQEAGVVAITIDDSGITAPATVPAGYAHVVFANTGEKPHVMEVDWRAEGVATEDVLSAPPLGVPDQVGAKTVVFLHPGAKLETVINFGDHPEYLVYESFVENPSTAAMVPSGTDGVIEPPSADVEVQLVNFAYVMPDPIPSGARWWHLVDTGTQQHEISLHPIGEGQTAQSILHDLAMIDANGQVPPSPTEIPELMVGAGQEAWVLWDLAAGKYLAACQVPDFSTMPPGMDHFNLGMFREFTVSP